MDQFAFHDIPDSISYILSTTNQSSLSYIGFSQGTAQAFATLSIHPTLNEKIDVFIALAPAMSPKGLTSQIVDTFVKASPEVLFLAFGRRAILGSATMWQAILYPPIFVRLIDQSLTFLFGWTLTNITPHQKLAAYPHLYSFSSTKSVVHWFQIIRNGHFQMYDDEAPPSLALTNPNKYYKIAKFPTRNIKTPIVLVYGGSDSLVDINVMLNELPRHTIAKEIPHYEHLDFLWGSSVDELVFPHVFEALEEYAAGETSSPSDSIYRKEKRREFLSSARFHHSEIKRLADTNDEEDEEDSSSLAAFRATKVSQNTGHQHLLSSDPETPSPVHATRKTSITRALSGNSKRTHSPSPARASAATPSSVQPVMSENSPPQDSPSGTQLTNQTSTSRPEGWWSSDEVAGSPKDSAVLTRSPSRNSFESGRGVYGLKGIQVGASKAVGGLVHGVGVGVGGGSGSPESLVANEQASAEQASKKKRWKGRKKEEVGV
jgi:lysosomal acid lipase/cholesteryl ester hydrolase